MRRSLNAFANDHIILTIRFYALLIVKKLIEFRDETQQL